MSLVWGTESIVFFNDAYAAALGKPGPAADRSDIEAVVDAVRQSGAVSIRGVPWRRHESAAAPFITHYSPVVDDAGDIAGVLAISVAADNDRRELGRATASVEAEVAQRVESERARLHLLHRLVAAQENERRRIARDLHDHVGQQLTALRLRVEAVREQFAATPAITGALAPLLAIVRELDRDIDFLAWELQPAALEELGLAAVLENYVREWARHTGVAATCHQHGMENTSVAPQIEASLYRIAQEALNNVAKHARATSVNVVLERTASGISLVVEDDGVGYRSAGDTETMIGLVGMRERATALGGTLDIEATPGGGTTILARVPVSLPPVEFADARNVGAASAPREEPPPALLNRLEELQRAIAARDDFIATVAHEFRNPLAPLAFQIRLAIDKIDQFAAAGEPVSYDWARSQFRRTEQRLHRVLETLDRLLDVSRLASGRIDLEPEDVDLATVVRDVIASSEAECAIARCDLRLTTRGHTTGWWDRVRLEQICRNLVSNAIRFGAGHPIDVVVAGDHHVVTLEVLDRGIGIPHDQQERIFERFEQGRSEQRSGGFGIGLWVVKNICAAMGGRIAVDSQVGRGTRFVVTLPRRITSAE